jgi:hypothetical protein
MYAGGLGALISLDPLAFCPVSQQGQCCGIDTFVSELSPTGPLAAPISQYLACGARLLFLWPKPRPGSDDLVDRKADCSLINPSPRFSFSCLH